MLSIRLRARALIRAPLFRRALALALLAVVPLASTGRALARGTRSGAFRLDAKRPRGALDCELAGGRGSPASMERCLREACAGENVTNAYIHDREGRIRRNPCFERSPFEPQR